MKQEYERPSLGRSGCGCPFCVVLASGGVNKRAALWFVLWWTAKGNKGPCKTTGSVERRGSWLRCGNRNNSRSFAFQFKVAHYPNSGPLDAAGKCTKCKPPRSLLGLPQPPIPPPLKRERRGKEYSRVAGLGGGAWLARYCDVGVAMPGTLPEQFGSTERGSESYANDQELTPFQRNRLPFRPFLRQKYAESATLAK